MKNPNQRRWAVSWIGHLENDEESSVVFATVDGVTAGSIRTSEGEYQLRYTRDGTYMVYEVDLSELPPELDPIEVYGEEDNADPEPDVANGSDTALLDLGVAADVRRLRRWDPDRLGRLLHRCGPGCGRRHRRDQGLDQPGNHRDQPGLTKRATSSSGCGSPIRAKWPIPNRAAWGPT